MMKHGISLEMIDLHNQEPNRNIRESKYFWDELYTLVSAVGFDALEIPYEPKWDFGGRSGIPRSMRSIKVKFQTPANYLSALESTGIHNITGVHLNPSIFLGNQIELYFEASYHFGVEAIDFASKMNADYFTLTATPSIGALKAICPDDTDWESFSATFLQQLTNFINKLAIHAKKRHIKLCLKNEYWSLLRGSNIIPFIRQLDHQVYWDLDTAHLKIAKTELSSIINEHASLIGCVHFTDTNFTDNNNTYKQLMPEYPISGATQVFTDIGQGSINFPSLATLLTDVNYNGWIVFNSKQTRDIYRALLRNRSYIDTKLSQFK